MTRDYTLAVQELRDHYNQLTALRKSIRSLVKAEFEPKIDFEIQRRIGLEEEKFANHVAAVKERESLPVTVIQDHVLRTRSWSRWVEIRDRAGLPGEMVKAEDVREAKRLEKSHFRWSDDYATLTVVKSVKGEDLETPVEYDMSTNRLIQGYYWPDAVNESAERAAWDIDGLPSWKRQLHAEVEAQIEAGNVTAPEGE